MIDLQQTDTAATFNVGRLTPAQPSQTILGPGTFKVQRPALGTKAIGVFDDQ